MRYTSSSAGSIHLTWNLVLASSLVASGALANGHTGALRTRTNAGHTVSVGSATLDSLSGPARLEAASRSTVRNRKPGKDKRAASLTRVTRKSLRETFPGENKQALMLRAVQSQWKPSRGWLQKHGNRRLLIVSDTHPGPGRNPIVGKVSPAEDFMPDRQEVDYANMLRSERARARIDGKKVTLVKGGDVLEFMQTSSPPTGEQFAGKTDAYGPLNTPETIISKLHTIHTGHPLMFRADAEHLLAGHSIAMLPGNHDRQLMHPLVRKALKEIMVAEIALLMEERQLAKKLGEQSGFRKSLTARERLQAAANEAKAQVEGLRRVGKMMLSKNMVAKAEKVFDKQYEFHPFMFALGDVWFQHGNELDPWNSFTTLLGDLYSKGGMNQEMEAAFGDYVVKAFFNDVETRVPFGDNGLSGMAFVNHVMHTHPDGRLAALKSVLKAFKFVGTREGHGSEREVRQQLEQEPKDLLRYVKEYGVAAQLNELRQGKPQLSDHDTVSLLLEYKKYMAPPALSFFRKDTGLLSRLAKTVFTMPHLLYRANSPKHAQQREDRANAFLMGILGVKTRGIGHDHNYRFERYLLTHRDGELKHGQLMDDATWTDELAGGKPRRDVLMTAIDGKRRGVIAVDFSSNGSYSQLMHWDPARNMLVEVSIPETALEAAGRR